MKTRQHHSAPGTTRQNPRGSRGPTMTLVASAVAFSLLAACSSDDDTNDGDLSPAPIDTSVAVTTNDGTSPGSVALFRNGIDASPVVLGTGANQGIAFDESGTLYQNSDSESATGMRAMGMAGMRADRPNFDDARDRMIGSTPGKGLVYLPGAELLVSADITDDASDLKLYATTADENAAPIATIDTPAPVWDLFYDTAGDRLYAAMVNGSLGIFDDFGAEPAAGPDRVLIPVDADGMAVSVNFHGVFVSGTTVLVSDVGDAASAEDGALFTFTDDGTIDGNTTDYTRITGANTLLGNPVDVVLDNGAAIVAEKSNDALLVFADVASLAGDVEPDQNTAFSKPESVELIVDATAEITDVNDIESISDVTAIAVTANPTPMQDPGDGSVDNSSVGRISLLSTTLDEVAIFNAGGADGDVGSEVFRTLENLQFDSRGNAFLVYDNTDGITVSGRGLLALHAVASRDGDDIDTDRDRLIGDSNSGLASPKGLEIVESQNAIIVADVGSDASMPALHVFSKTAGSSATPLFSVTDTGSAAIWDIDYDAGNDRLYAAGTGGDILVYDNFFALGATAVPSRSIQASTAGTTANMHGIVHVAGSDQLIVSDVGDAASVSDGKLYVIDAASTANGMVMPTATIAGPASLLGNPVDLAFDGESVYVAEKSNDRILRFDTVLTLSGSLEMAADAEHAYTKPESVSLVGQSAGLIAN